MHLFTVISQFVVGRVGRRSEDDTPSHVHGNLHSDPRRQRWRSVRTRALCLPIVLSSSDSAAGSIFSNLLHQNMAKLVPNLPATLIAAVEESVSIIHTLDPSMREIVVEAYTKSIARMFLIGVAAGGLAFLSGL